jgi:2'-5' RNA ligase
VRTFVAIFPPPEVREEVLSAARLLRLGDRIRWVKAENFHLTLRFLGDVQEENLGGVCAALEKVCAGHAPFDIGLLGLGAFPSARRARILWAGVGEGSEQLRSLARGLDVALASLGFEGEVLPYTPHFTLGRVRGRPARLELPSGIGDYRFGAGSLELVESSLDPGGAAYKTIVSFALG